jgi:hypothetical protein
MGKHRGSTKLEMLGNSGDQNTRRSLHFKGFFAYRRKSGKFRELGTIRMAFTRSGVRLPLAPPSSAVFGRLASYEKFLTGAYACLEAHVALSDKKQATIPKDT